MNRHSNNIVSKISSAAENSKNAVIKSKDNVISTGKDAKAAVMSKMDANNDGTIDIEDIIILGMKTPGVKVERASFLMKELKNTFGEAKTTKAIAETPLAADITVEQIDKIANEVIQNERYYVSGISAALGAPGGAAMAATIPADIIQYYGYMLRAAQKLMYLYGFPEIISTDDDVQIDSSAMNMLIVSLGVMFGVANANNAIKAMAKALGTGVNKQLMNKALTKGTIYPIVKMVSKWFGVHMTKEVFAGFFKKAIPVVGGIIGGGITYTSFKLCCDRLKDNLKDTCLSNPMHDPDAEEIKLCDQIIC